MTVRHRVLWLVILAVAVLVIGAACGPRQDDPEPGAPSTPKPAPAPATPTEVPQVFRGPEHEPAGLDPAKGGHGYYAAINMFDTIVDSYTSPGEVKPLAAERWEWSDGGKTLTFFLRNDMKWTDGAPVTAHDFAWSWIRQLDPATASYDPSKMFAVVNAREFNRGEITDPDQVAIKALDDFTLELKLNEPAPWLLQAIGTSRWMVVPRQAIEVHGDRWVEPGNIITCGAYTMESWAHDQRLVLVRNEDWWGETPVLERIEFQLMESAWERGILAFEAGEVDTCVVPATELDRVSRDPVMSEQLVSFPIMGTIIYNVDTSNPPLDDVRVRQAIHMVIDRDVLTRDLLGGAYKPAWSLIPPNVMGRNAGSALTYDVARAQQLLAEAGYPDGQGLRDITISFWPGGREQTTAEAIQAMVKDAINVNIRLEPIEYTAMQAWRTARRDQSYDLYIAWAWGGTGDPSDWHNSIWDSNSVRYWTRYANDEYDLLVRSALTEVDEQRRADLYSQAEALINHDLPTIPLHYEGQVHLVSPRVQGLEQATSSLAVTRIFRYGVRIVEP